jgi:peptide deformylase
MAILKIARMGHPLLRRKAAPVADPTAPEIRRLVQDMLETMEDAGGTGLAAPQVHVPLRLVVFFVAGRRAALEEGQGEDGRELESGGREDVPLTILANPEIEPLTEATALGPEACLSVPGLVGQVPRWTRIRYRGLTLEGAPLERVAEGFHARVVQHECDHLDGILYPQRMTDLSLLAFASEVGRMAEGAPTMATAPDADGPDDRTDERADTHG